jgi:hypothetical protein
VHAAPVSRATSRNLSAAPTAPPFSTQKYDAKWWHPKIRCWIPRRQRAHSEPRHPYRAGACRRSARHSATPGSTVSTATSTLARQTQGGHPRFHG